MSRLEWDLSIAKHYHAGLDHGVLYLEGQSGIVWNGLLEVDDTTSVAVESYFFDGQKYSTLVVEDSFEGNIKAITYPDEFLAYDGFGLVEDGLTRADQKRKIFGMSYRTLIIDDFTGQSVGQQIHILYNLTAKPDDKSFETIEDSNVDPIFFGWQVTSRPEKLSEYKPTSHVIADSRYLAEGRLSRLEDALYGTDDSEPYLPRLPVLLELLESGFTIIITDNGNGTWTADGPSEYITMLDSTTFEITDVDATYLDADTYEVQST